MTQPKIDHTAIRYKYAKKPVAATTESLHRDGRIVQQAFERARAKAKTRTSGNLHKSERESLTKKEHDFANKVAALWRFQFATPEKTLQKADTRMTAQLNTKHTTRQGAGAFKKTVKLPRMDFASLNLIKYIDTQARKDDLLQHAVDLGLKHKNIKLLKAAIATGIDNSIIAPLRNLKDHMSARDLKKYATLTGETITTVSKKKSKTSKAQPDIFARIQKLQRAVVRIGKMESTYDMSLLLGFEALAEDVVPAIPDDVTRGKAWLQMAQAHPIEEDASFYYNNALMAAHQAPGDTKKSQLLRQLRDNTDDMQLRHELHKEMLQDATAGDIITDAVKLVNTYIAGGKTEGTYYHMAADSAKALQQQKSSMTLAQQRVYQRNKTALNALPSLQF